MSPRPPRQRSHAPLRWGLLAIAFLVPVLLGVVAQPWLESAVGAPWWWIGVVAAAQASVAATLLLTKRLLPDERASTTERLDATARELPRIRHMRRLLKLITGALVRCLGASHATIYIEGSETAAYWLSASHGVEKPTTIDHLKLSSPLIRWMLQHRKPLRRQDCLPQPQRNGKKPDADPFQRLYLILENLKAEVIVPSFRGQRLLGFLALGKRADRRAYTDAEVGALARLARDCAVALDNALSYEQLQTTAHKLQSAQDRLLRQERMVAAGKLAMGLAHEVKNPLAAIKTFSEFLPERHDDPTFRQEFAQVVGKEIDRISRIVQSLSDFAKPVMLKLESMDVQQVLRETLTLLSNDCLKHHVAVRQTFEPQPILLPGDPSQLKQVFLNLCVNALQAMEREGGTLSVSCQCEAGEAVIRIADTGGGIPQEHLAVLFDPFFSTKESGMGLGLAVVKQIIEQHVGAISVDSLVGRGTTFEIRLPLAVRFVPRETRVPPTTPAEPPVRKASLGLDLLVVDDEPKIGSMLQTCYEAMGCRVRVTKTGEEALRLIGQQPPQLVLLDLTLAELDGFEVLKRVKLAYPALPVVIITGSDDADVDSRVRELGALDCFHKPLDMPTLQQRTIELAPRLPTAPVTPSRNHDEASAQDAA